MSWNAKRALSIGVAVMLIVAGCGGDGESSDTPAASTTSTTAVTVVPTALPNIPGLSDECSALANLILAATQAFTGTDVNVDEMFAAAESKVPNELREDVLTIKEAVDSFAAAMAELGVNPFQDPTVFASLTPEQLALFEEMTAVLDTDEVNAAFDRISAWGEAECDQFVPGS